MKTKLSKYFLLIVGLNATIYAMNLEDKYPSYRYVFNEFSVDKSYIHNEAFRAFSKKNELFLYRFYTRSLKQGKSVLPIMRGLLVGEGISDLFIYLSMIESGFSSAAISSKKAVGLWQFMPATAKHYNLNVSEDYDERYDTALSTSAAIRYLSKLHRQFDKWYLAVMAFNCGEGCVEKAIKSAGTDDLSVLIDDTTKYLPKETRDYIKKILLIAMIGEDNAEDSHAEPYTIEVKVNAGTQLKNLAREIDMKCSTLQKLNLSIKNGLVPRSKKQYSIYIPTDKVFSFYLRYELAHNQKDANLHLLQHYVLLGDTLVSIANKYDTSAREITVANNLESDYLTLDQFLLIPVSKKTFDKISEE